MLKYWKCIILPDVFIFSDETNLPADIPSYLSSQGTLADRQDGYIPSESGSSHQYMASSISGFYLQPKDMNGKIPLYLVFIGNPFATPHLAYRILCLHRSLPVGYGKWSRLGGSHRPSALPLSRSYQLTPLQGHVFHWSIRRPHRFVYVSWQIENTLLSSTLLMKYISSFLSFLLLPSFPLLLNLQVHPLTKDLPALMPTAALNRGTTFCLNISISAPLPS